MSVKQLFMKCANPAELAVRLKAMNIKLVTEFKRSNELRLPGEVVKDRCATTVDQAILFKRFLDYLNLPTKLLLVKVDLGMRERLYTKEYDYQLFVLFENKDQWFIYCPLNWSDSATNIYYLTDYEDWVCLKGFECATKRLRNTILVRMVRNSFDEKFFLSYYPKTATYSYTLIENTDVLTPEKLVTLSTKTEVIDLLLGKEVVGSEDKWGTKVDKRYWGEEEIFAVPGINHKLKVDTPFDTTEIILPNSVYNALEESYMVSYDRRLLVIKTKLFEEKPELIERFHLVETPEETTGYIMIPLVY